MNSKSLLDEIDVFISKNQLSILNKEKIIRYVIAFYKTKKILAEILQTSKLTLNTKDEDLFHDPHDDALGKCAEITLSLKNEDDGQIWQ